MGKIYQHIDRKLTEWIGKQALFFVATAPLAKRGHVNLSPKGPIGSLRVVDDKTIAYLDAVGSGAETIAHLRENGRIVVMLCAFHGPPRIVRFHGRGTIVLPRAKKRWSDLFARCGFEDPGLPETRRAIVVVDVTRIADSCGYGVPRMKLEGARTHMDAWAKKKLSAGPDAIAEYKRVKNARSIDGLPALT